MLNRRICTAKTTTTFVTRLCTSTFMLFLLWQNFLFSFSFGTTTLACTFFKGSFCLLFSSRSSFPLLLLPLIVTSLVHLCCLSVFFFFLLSPLPNPPFFLPHCLSFLFLYVGFCRIIPLPSLLIPMLFPFTPSPTQTWQT